MDPWLIALYPTVMGIIKPSLIISKLRKGLSDTDVRMDVKKIRFLSNNL